MDLLNPHIFSKEDLLKILSEKYLNLNNLENEPFEKLLELYYNFVLPLHQRESANKNIGTNISCTIHNGSSNHRLKSHSGGTDSTTHPKRNENGYKHKRIEYSNDTRMNKKLKILNGTRNESQDHTPSPRIMQKRLPESPIGLPLKHKKITWP